MQLFFSPSESLLYKRLKKSFTLEKAARIFQKERDREEISLYGKVSSEEIVIRVCHFIEILPLLIKTYLKKSRDGTSHRTLSIAVCRALTRSLNSVVYM